jgi:PhnB protein
MAVKPVPEGYRAVTPYLIIKGAAQAIEFYKKAFGAQELYRMPGPDDTIMHAEIKIIDTPIMLADEFPEQGYRSPQSLNGTSVSLMLYVEDVDRVFQQALEAGGTEIRPVKNEFYGDRNGTLRDPFGHIWTVSTHVEDVSQEEMNRRIQEMEQQQ